MRQIAPYDTEVLWQLLAQHQAAGWPATLVLLALALIMVRGCRVPDDAVARRHVALTGLLWISVGVGYHGVFYRDLNWAAIGFAALFVLQGCAVLARGWVGRSWPRTAASASWVSSARIGALAVVTALLLYPLLEAFTLPDWRATGWVGMTPDLTLLFVLGVCLLSRLLMPWYLWLLPLLWAAYRLWWTTLLALPVASLLALLCLLLSLLGIGSGMRRHAR